MIYRSRLPARRNLWAFTRTPETKLPPLNQPYGQPINAKPMLREDTKTTTLSNGVRVVTEDNGGFTSYVGVYSGLGTRHEPVKGLSHLRARMLLQNTTCRFNSVRVVRDVAETGCLLNSDVTRETTSFSVAGLRENVSSGFEILADLLRNGKFEEWQTKDAQVWTNDLIAETAEKNKIDEAMHSTAYGFSALGQPQYPDETSYEHVPHSLVAEWNNNFLTDTSKLVVAAQNIPHNVAVNLAEKFFGDLKKTDRTVTSNPARYVGGDYRNYNGSQGSVQVGLGFATPGYTELGKDYLVYHLLQFILGSGADFSSGGPGKGIHTRLSKDIAYTNGTVMSVGAQVRPYSDSGLFYVEAQAFTNGQRITQQLIDQLNGLESIAQKDFKNDEELVRAKNRLKSHYLQSAEDEATNVSDMAYQTLLQGSRPSTAEVFAALDKLTGADVTKAVRYMFSKKPTFVAFGDLAGVHPYHEIEKRFS